MAVDAAGARAGGDFVKVAEAVAIEVGGVEIGGGLVAADEAEEAFGGGAIHFITHGSGDAWLDVRCPRPVAKIGSRLDEVGIIFLPVPMENFFSGSQSLETEADLFIGVEGLGDGVRYYKHTEACD